MSESIALQLLRVLIVAFPPLAAMLSRLLPSEDDGDPLVAKVRDILPVEGESAQARRTLESNVDLGSDALDEPDTRAP